MILFGLNYSVFKTRQLQSFTKMQPSIKMFFKATPTKRPSQKQDEETDLATPLTPVKNNTPSKRPADSEDDNELVLSCKRRAISPATDLSSNQNTPVKAMTDKLKDEQDGSEIQLATPTKQQVDKSTPVATPLIDLNIVIRKKISSGAYALHENIGLSWFKALQSEFEKPYFRNLSNFVRKERQSKTVYPPENKVYSWTHHHDIKDTRVIILGQDPYHGPGQAHGLSFSVMRGVRLPPSLINIFKELQNDVPDFVPPKDSGDLTGWAKQGVLLLNTCLSVNQGQANSHQNKGWETFTDAVISWLSKNLKHKLVFLLWGRPAQRKASMIDKRHKVLTAAHPSPLSAHNGFFGCGHFSKANSFLKDQNLKEIDWKAL